MPRKRFSACTVYARSASPPEMIVRVDAGICPPRASSSSTDGVPEIVMGANGGIPSKSDSGLSTRIVAPPRTSGPNTSKIEKSNAGEDAASTALISASSKAASAPRKNATTLRCSNIIPLGRPVDPEV